MGKVYSRITPVVMVSFQVNFSRAHLRQAVTKIYPAPSCAGYWQ